MQENREIWQYIARDINMFAKYSVELHIRLKYRNVETLLLQFIVQRRFAGIITN